MSSEDFGTTFDFCDDYPYDPKEVDRIVANRKALHHTLFIDRLLQVLGIDSASRLYPPKSVETFRKLHERVLASSSPDHHKQSVIYYFLKDCEDATEKSSSCGFAQQCFLPPKYRIFMDGLWYLDNLEFERALSFLTDPSLIPTFVDEILYILSTVPKDDDGLAVAYYIAVSPPLASRDTLFAYFRVLCRIKISTALYFTRTQPKKTRRELFDQLIVSVLSSKAGDARAEKAMELVYLPFSEAETEWFEDCLQKGKARKLPGAKDTAMMRRVTTGRLDNLGRLEALSGRQIDGLNWDVLKTHLKPSLS